MDLEKMNESINDMEEIVEKMTNIKDSYEMLQQCSDKLDYTRKNVTQQLYEFDATSASLKKAYVDLRVQNEQISQKVLKDLTDAIAEITILRNKMQEEINGMHKKMDQTAVNIENKVKEALETESNKAKMRHGDEMFLIVLSLIIGVINIILILK